MAGLTYAACMHTASNCTALLGITMLSMIRCHVLADCMRLSCSMVPTGTCGSGPSRLQSTIIPRYGDRSFGSHSHKACTAAGFPCCCSFFNKFQPLRSESTSCLAGYVCWCWVPPLLWLVGRRQQQAAGVATGPRRLPARQQVKRGSNLAQLCCLIMRAPHRPITVTVASRRKTTAESAVLRCQQQSMQVSDVTPYCATHHTSSYKCAKYQAPTGSFVSMSQLHQRRGRRCRRECLPPCARAGLGVRCCDHHLPAAQQ